MTENTNTQNANSIIDPQLIALQKLLEENPQAISNIVNKAEESSKPTINLDRNKSDGAVKNTMHNLRQILQFDPKLKGKFGYNESTQDYTVKEDIELPAETVDGKATIKLTKGKLDDTDMDLLCNYLSDNENYKIETDTKHLMMAMKWVQRVQSYDPLKDYFDGLKWDGKHRLDTVMQEYLGAVDSEYNKFQIKLWMMGAVAKVYNKLQKFDFCLDLVGGQGAGKTTFLQKISPLGMYVQDFPDFSSKDAKMIMKSALIVNDDEMTATKNSTFEQIKNFITATKIEYRAPYGRLPLTFNKSFVIARTGNEIQHLADPSGQRRFLVIQCGLKKHKVVYSDLKQDYIDQIWAEAKHDYDEANKNGDPFSLTPEQEEMLNRCRRPYIKTNSTQDGIADLLSLELSNSNFISNDDMRVIAAWKLGKERIGINSKDERSLRATMSNNGWMAGIIGRDEENGKEGRGYRRIKPIKIDPNTWGIKEWIASEVRHEIVNNGKHRPVNANEFKPYVAPDEKDAPAAKTMPANNNNENNLPF